VNAMKRPKFLSGLFVAIALSASTTEAYAGGHETMLQGAPQSFPANTFVRAFPGNTFSSTQVVQFERLGIGTMSDLIEADPRLLSRVLDIDLPSAQALQQGLRQRMQ
jgi:hypothetical protein